MANNMFEQVLVRVIASHAGRMTFSELREKFVEVSGPAGGEWLDAEYKAILTPKPRYKHFTLSNGDVQSEEI